MQRCNIVIIHFKLLEVIQRFQVVLELAPCFPVSPRHTRTSTKITTGPEKRLAFIKRSQSLENQEPCETFHPHNRAFKDLQTSINIVPKIRDIAYSRVDVNPDEARDKDFKAALGIF
jgi:hypothetical protein